MSKRFAYCIGGCRSTPAWLDALTTDNSDCFALFYRAPGPPGTYFDPNTTANSGRNVMFAEAAKGDYEYIIFMDDDVAFPGRTHEQGFREFEALVDEFHPAIASPAYPWHLGASKSQTYLRPEARVQGVIALDICLNAVHRSVWNWLLPYWTDFDSLSWWNAAHVFNRVAAVLWPGGAIQFNELPIINLHSGPYPREDRCKAADKMIGEMLADGMRHLAWPHDSDESFRSPCPLLRQDYTLSRDEVERYFDLSHPYWRERA